MKFKTTKHTEKTNVTAKKTIKAKIGNPAKMLKMFTKDLYKYPLQTAIQEYINNAKDAHVMVGKDTSTIEITAPTLANQNVIIKDYGPGLSETEMVDIFANVTVSNKDNSDKFIGGYGIGSKSWFAIYPSFNVVSVTNHKKIYYSVKYDDKEGISIDVEYEEETNEPNGLELQLPLANVNQINTANNAIFRAVEFWEVKPKLVNLENQFYPIIEDTKDYTLISYNQKGKFNQLYVTLGRTQYSIKDLPCNDTVNQLMKYYNIAVHFDVGEMKLGNTQEVGPDREAFSLACNDKILNKIKDIQKHLMSQIIDKLDKSTDIKEINELISHPSISSYNFKDQAKKFEFSKKITLLIKANRNENLDLKYLPIKLSKFNSYLAIDDKISSAYTYLENCVKTSYVLLVDEDDVPETKIKESLNNAIKHYDSRGYRRTLYYTGITFFNTKDKLDNNDIEILKKYFTFFKYSEIKVLKPKVVKNKVEKNPNEINLMRVNFGYCLTNIKKTINELDKKEYEYLSIEDYNKLNICQKDFNNIYNVLKRKVFVVSLSNEKLFKTLQYKKFDYKQALSEIEKVEKERLDELRKKAKKSKIFERYSLYYDIEWYKSFVNGNMLIKKLIQECKHPLFVELKKCGYDKINLDSLYNEYYDEYGKILDEDSEEQKTPLGDMYQEFSKEYRFISSNLNYINDNSYKEIKFLLENYVKK